MTKFNIFILILSLFLGTQIASAQSSAESIALHVIVPDQEEDFFTDKVKSRLETKVEQIAGSGGVTGAAVNPRFIIVPKVDLDGFETVASAPPKFIAKLEVTLYVAGYQTKLRFGNTSITAKGVGRNEKEAFYKAINSIRTRSPKLEAFIKDSKLKIVKHYEQNCDKILAEAQQYLQMTDYTSAIALLMTIPVEAENCFSSANEMAVFAYQQHLEQECKQLLQTAKLAAANREFSTALGYLAHVNASTECADQLQFTIDEISMLVDEIDRREWKLMLQKLDNEFQLEALQIEAMREIAISKYRRDMDQINFFLIGR